MEASAEVVNEVVGDNRCERASSPAGKASAWDPLISAVSAVVVGLVPLVYTMYPGLAAAPGFWRAHRLLVTIVWAVAVACLIATAASRQERVQRKRHATVEAINDAVTRAESAVTQVEGSLGRAHETLGRTVEAAARLTYTTRMAELSRSAGEVLAASRTAAMATADGPLFPPGSHFLIHVYAATPGSEVALWPLYPYEQVIDPLSNEPVERRLRPEEVTQRVLPVQCSCRGRPPAGLSHTCLRHFSLRARSWHSSPP